MSRLCQLFFIAITVCGLFAGKAEQSSKELVTYIEGARRTGLTDEQIRKNMGAAGWDSRLVDDAFATMAAARPAPQAAATTDLPDGYRLGSGDILQVSVWREPDASVPSVVVRGDGNISLPLIKDVAIAGLPPGEAEKVIATKLARYIHAADVTIIVREIHSQKVYMVGAVRTVGPVQLTGKMTVLQAITQAGGLTDYAKRKKIYVLRTENGKQLKLPFNYEAVIKGEGVDQNILLSPNDTIVVP
jgi:polysaccharide export outer membrane protein